MCLAISTFKRKTSVGTAPPPQKKKQRGSLVLFLKRDWDYFFFYWNAIYCRFFLLLLQLQIPYLFTFSLSSSSLASQTWGGQWLMQSKLLRPSAHRGKKIEIPFPISDFEFIIRQILVIFGCWAITFFQFRQSWSAQMMWCSMSVEAF